MGRWATDWRPSDDPANPNEPYGFQEVVKLIEHSGRTEVSSSAAQMPGGRKKRVLKRSILGWLIWFVVVVLLSYLINLLKQGR
jgi:hypothetical protein